VICNFATLSCSVLLWRADIDHIVELSKGGDNSDRNLCTLCHRCQVLNEVSSDRTFPYSQLFHQNEELLVFLLTPVVYFVENLQTICEPLW